MHDWQDLQLIWWTDRYRFTGTPRCSLTYLRLSRCPSPDHLDNELLLPHSAESTLTCVSKALEQSVDNLKLYINGKDLINERHKKLDC